MENDRYGEERDLEELTKDLKHLQLQINNVNRQINNIQSKQNTKEPIVSNKKRTLKLRDTAVVTGTYWNRKGVTGKVVKITPA
jgi:chromosome segregation ATPase